MKKELLNLQLFAGEDEQEAQPTETVETEDNQTTEFDDNPEVEENETTETEGDQKEQNQKAIEEQKEANRQAYLRRKQEAQLKQQQENEKRASYVEGLKKAVGGENPYTHKKIVDEEDVIEYENMLALAQQGRDPIEDYSAYIKEKAKAERLAKEEESKRALDGEKQVQKSLDDFVNKYGIAEAQKILNDKSFIEFGKDLIDSGASLEVVYNAYKRTQASIEKKSEAMVIQKEARRQSSPGRPNSSTSIEKSYANMSQEEFDKRYKELLNR